MKMAMLSVYPWGGLSALKIIRVVVPMALPWAGGGGHLALDSSQLLFSAEKSGTASWFPDLDFQANSPSIQSSLSVHHSKFII